MDLHLLIKVLHETVSSQSKMIASLQEGNAIQANLIEAQSAQIKNLEAIIALLKNKKNSNNSHLPPSKDENRIKKNQSLREKTIENLAVNRATKAQPLSAATRLTR